MKTISLASIDFHKDEATLNIEQYISARRAQVAVFGKAGDTKAVHRARSDLIQLGVGQLRNLDQGRNIN